MKIVILEGSPNRNGSSNMLAEYFKQGAEESLVWAFSHLLFLMPGFTL